jgi:alpha-N-arabinofuranosidase
MTNFKLTLMIMAVVGISSCNGFNKTNKKYHNPILAGFYPDPSICRVGKDYYLVNSSFSYFPGVPIFHSKDLVHWEQIGNVLDRPEQLDLDNQEVNQGIYAPTIRYNNGTFYMITTNVGGKGNFYVTAKKPQGPWSNPIWLPDVVGIDPSFYFDEDGKAYVIFNGAPPDSSLYDGHRALWIYDFDPKLKTTTGEKTLLVNGGTDISKKPIWIEGPHIYKKDNFYYLMAAEGGTEINHSEVIFRSDKIKGPYVVYENNPILTQRNLDPGRKNPVTNTGHADLVETQNGEWWSVFLGCRPYEDNFFNTGRETFLTPVKWENGWPIINPGTDIVKFSYPIPNLPSNKISDMPTSGNFTIVDDFNEDKLENYWLFLRTPREKWYSLDAIKSVLKIKLRPQLLSGKDNPSFIGRRQQHTNFTATVKFKFKPLADNETAGLAAIQNDQYFYYLGITKNKGKDLVRLIKEIKFALAGSVRKIFEPVEAKDTKLYQKERWGGEFGYSFPVDKKGKYKVTLKFAETYWYKEGSRIFDVKVETKILPGLDIFKMAGKRFKAVDTSVIVEANEGHIDVDLLSKRDNASICGIVISTLKGDIVYAVNCGDEPHTSPDGIKYDRDDLYLKKNYEPVKILAELPIALKDKIYLKIEGKGRLYSFYYSADSEKWIPVMESVDGKYLSTQIAGGFVGTILGMYASSQGKKSNNYAEYDWFEYTGNDEVFK